MNKEISLVEAVESPYANIKSLVDLLHVAVKVKDQMIVRNYITNQVSKINRPLVSSEYNNKYYHTNGVITFFYENENYEIPYSEHIEKVLIDSGFEQKQYWVTFCNGQYPRDYEEYWVYLKGVSNALYSMKAAEEIKRIKEELVEYAKEKGIKPLDAELYDRCLRIPDRGYTVINATTENKKIESPDIFDVNSIHHAKDKVGKFKQHPSGGGYSGITFVDIDGSTYITESKEVLSELIKNGFQETEQIKFLGLGWNEYFEDPFVEDLYQETIISDEVYYKKKQTGNNKVEEVVDKLEKARNEIERMKEENRKLRELLANVNINIEDNNNTTGAPTLN